MISWKKVFLKALVFSFLPFFIFSQNILDLKKIQPDWVCVLGGNVLCQPERTSAGYICTGEGKNVYCFTDEGKILWSKSFSQKIKNFISAGPEDFITVISKNSNLNLLNQSGSVVWTADCGFEVIQSPLWGWDGRIFVRGKEKISCFSLNGVCRWTVTVKNQNTSLPLKSLNDGSLIAFTETTKDGKSTACRLTPFGEVMEQIVFAGKVHSVTESKEGLILTFSDGGFGLYAANSKGESFSRWAVSASSLGLTFPTVCACNSSSQQAVFFSGTPVKAFSVNLKNADIKSVYEIPVTSAEQISYAENTAQGLTVRTKENAWCFSENGTVLWNVKMSPQKKVPYVFSTDSGYFVLCTNNWVIEAYRVKQGVKGAFSSSFKRCELKQYKSHYEKNIVTSSAILGPAITDKSYREIKESFTKGNFPGKEKLWLALLNAELENMYFQWKETSWDFTAEKPFFKQNIVYNQTILDLVSSSGLSFGTKYTASLMKEISDPELLLFAVQCAGKMKFDPEGDLLNALDFVLKNKASASSTVLLEAIANSTYEICSFMGKPSFIKKGQDMLTYMLYPQFSFKTQENARLILSKIIEKGL